MSVSTSSSALSPSALIRLATVLLLPAQTFALPWTGSPSQTQTYAVDKFSPRPTSGPGAAIILGKRGDLGVNTCGWIGGISASPVACGAASSCVHDTLLAVVGCCATSGPCNDGVYTTCVDAYNPWSENSGLADNGVISCTGSDLCYKNSFPGGYFNYNCGQTSEATVVETTYAGMPSNEFLQVVYTGVAFSPTPSASLPPVTTSSPSSSESSSHPPSSSHSPSSHSSSGSSSVSSSATSSSISSSISSSPVSSSAAPSSSGTSIAPGSAITATPPPIPSPSSGGSANKGAIVGGVMGGVLAVMGAVAFAAFCCTSRSGAYMQRSKASEWYHRSIKKDMDATGSRGQFQPVGADDNHMTEMAPATSANAPLSANSAPMGRTSYLGPAGGAFLPPMIDHNAPTGYSAGAYYAPPLHPPTGPLPPLPEHAEESQEPEPHQGMRELQPLVSDLDDFSNSLNDWENLGAHHEVSDVSEQAPSAPSSHNYSSSVDEGVAGLALGVAASRDTHSSSPTISRGPSVRESRQTLDPAAAYENARYQAGAAYGDHDHFDDAVSPHTVLPGQNHFGGPRTRYSSIDDSHDPAPNNQYGRDLRDY